MKRQLNKRGFTDDLLMKLIWVIIALGGIYAVYKLVSAIIG
jgi:hypothetical protein